jgi:transposase
VPRRHSQIKTVQTGRLRLAGQHAMNANVLHRWLKEHHRSGRHQLAAHSPAAAAAPETASPLAAFIPLELPAAAQQPEAREIKVELRKGALSMVVTWPVSAAAELASWTAAVLKRSALTRPGWPAWACCHGNTGWFYLLDLLTSGTP